MNKMKSYALTVLAALIYHLGHPNLFGVLIPFAPIIGSSLLIWKILSSNTKTGIKHLLIFNLVISLSSFYWITATLQEFGQLPFIIAAIGNISYSLIFQPYYFLFILLIFVFKKLSPSFLESILNSSINRLTIAVLFTIIEYFTPQQFPVLLGQPWIIFGEYLGLAKFFGLPAFSFFSYLMCLEIISFFKAKNISKLNISYIVLFTLFNIFSIPSRDLAQSKESDLIKIRMVQANISNFLKVDSEGGNYASVEQVINAYKELSILPWSDGTMPDLIIWPETAYPYAVKTDQEDISRTKMPDVLDEVIKQTRAQVISGGYDNIMDSEGFSFYKTDYNTAFYQNADSTLVETYHKQILIPFGETLPFGVLNKKISKMIPTIAFFAEGTKFPLFRLDHHHHKISFLPTICYELLKPEFIRNYIKEIKNERPDFLLNLTNDSWYGNTLQPEQHLFLARWRSLEFALPMLRSTNTGITVALDGFGQEIERLAYDKKGNLDLSLNFRHISGTASKNTYFSQYGFFLMLPLWFLCFIFHLLLIKLRHVKNN